jgi:hypothetical protein
LGTVLEVVLDENRLKPQRRFVEHQQIRFGYKNTANGHHLLLASGKGHSQVVLPFGQTRQQAVDLLQRFSTSFLTRLW